MSLIGWWPLHRTQGKALDMSGNGNHGTHDGTTRGVAGIGGLQATSFDGSDDVISLGSSIKVSGSFSMCGWVKMDSLSTDIMWAVDGERNGVGHEFRESNGFEAFAFDGSSIKTITSGKKITDEWIHHAWIYDEDSNQLEYFINTESQGTVSITGFDDTGTEDTIGAGRTTDNADGQIADVRFYDRALSSSEIQTLYEWGSRTGVTDARLHNGRDPGAVARYTLDGSAEDVWGPNNGTNNGATYVNNSIRGQAGRFQRSNTDGIDLPNLGISGDQAHTISAWVNFAGSLSQNQTIYAQGSRSTDNQIDFIYLGNRSQLVASFYNNDLGYTFNPATDVWYHIATTYDGSIRQLYFNGEVRASDSPSAPSIDNKNYSIGYREADTDSYLDGSIDDVRIYDRALSPSEVHQLYQWGTRGIDMRRKLVNKR